jgi:3-dehydroquinate synthase
MNEATARTVPVSLGSRSYDIVIAADAIAGLGQRLAGMFGSRRYGIVTDDNVARAQLPRLIDAFSQAGLDHTVVTVPAGEASKSFATLQTVVEALLAARLERADLVVAFGGGVIGDLAGFAAAITRRGMDLVQVPTSLLAQVDSAVGGKTGINSPLGKNLIGAFHQPRLVVADLETLDTLPEREFRAGYAEVVKYALIDRPEMLDWLEANRQTIFAGGAARAEAIARCCEAKAEFVAADEREAGRRALLNLGHTFAHALEAAAGYSGRLLHGEAVAVGCVLAHRFSASMGLAPAADAERLAAHLRSAGLPTTLSGIDASVPPAAELMELIAQDKKISGGALAMVLTRGIGQAFVERGVDPARLQAFLTDEMK